MLLQKRNAFGHAFIKDIAGNAGDKPLQPTFPDKGGRLRSLLFFTLQPHRPKTRHQKWPSETENRNDAPVARSGTRRLSLIRRMGPICADFGGGKSSSAASAATRRARSNPVSFMSMPSGNMPRKVSQVRESTHSASSADREKKMASIGRRWPLLAGAIRRGREPAW